MTTTMAISGIISDSTILLLVLFLTLNSCTNIPITINNSNTFDSFTNTATITVFLNKTWSFDAQEIEVESPSNHTLIVIKLEQKGHIEQCSPWNIKRQNGLL